MPGRIASACTDFRSFVPEARSSLRLVHAREVNEAACPRIDRDRDRRSSTGGPCGPRGNRPRTSLHLPDHRYSAHDVPTRAHVDDAYQSRSPRAIAARALAGLGDGVSHWTYTSSHHVQPLQTRLSDRVDRVPRLTGQPSLLAGAPHSDQSQPLSWYHLAVRWTPSVPKRTSGFQPRSVCVLVLSQTQ